MNENETTIYDINKQLKTKERILTDKEIKNKISDIVESFLGKWPKYLMLLSNENKDYTIFDFSKAILVDSFKKDLEIALRNRGLLLTFEKTNEGAWEIWIRNKETLNNSVYYLFDYTEGVISYE